MSERCRTRYPLLLAHGLNCRDHWPLDYWGRIPEALRAEGAVVYLGGQDAWGSVEDNARQLQAVLLRALEETGAEKVNLIAHSKGGLEARYLISCQGLADRVASLTTVCTPHHGSRTADRFLAHPALIRVLDGALRGFWRLAGDDAPRPSAAAESLSTAGAEVFNAACPDAPGVYYQSWGADLGDARDDKGMALLSRFMGLADGATDGLVRPDSARWTNYRGDVTGVSHQDMTDTRQAQLSGFDPVEFYLAMAEQLQELGF